MNSRITARREPPAATPLDDGIVWWNSIQDLVETPLGDLVDGLAEVADHAIPYSRLPGRVHTNFATDFTTWCDLSTQTITTLLDRPKAGISTVRSIVIAAHEAVTIARTTPSIADETAAAAIHRLIDRLSDYDHTVLSARGWAINPRSTAATAEQLGVAPINVQRNQVRSYRRLRELLADPTHAAINGHARDLNRRLGILTSEDTARQALNDLGLDFDADDGQLLLHVAGPYAPHDDWLTDTSAGGLPTVIKTYETILDNRGAPTTARLIEELGAIGVNLPAAAAFIERRPGVRRVNDKWVRWGSTQAVKTEAALQLLGEPATPAEIADVIDCPESSVRNILHTEPRFIRATKQTWALRTWGLTEYTGLYAEIAAQLAAGPKSTQAVMDDVGKAVPDAAESSIRSFLSAPGFIIENGMVRLRTQDDGWRQPAPATTTRGVFRQGRSRIRIARPIDAELLRGSGEKLNPTIASALGIHPDQQRTFTGTHDITLSWRPSSLNGADIGSLRGPATALHAQLGDTIVLTFDVKASTIDYSLIPSDADLPTRLSALLGIPVTNPIADLARALNCKRSEVTELLTRRGDTYLLTAIDGAHVSSSPAARHARRTSQRHDRTSIPKYASQ